QKRNPNTYLEKIDILVEQEIDRIKEKIKDVLGDSKEKIESKFNITVEVAGFTVKTISALKEQAKTDEVEQNFLATVLHNHSFMSGNEEVKNKFVGIIQQNLKFEE